MLRLRQYFTILLLLSAIFIVLYGLGYLQNQWNLSNELSYEDVDNKWKIIEKPTLKIFNQWLANYRFCLIHGLSTLSKWNTFNVVINRCNVSYARKLLEVKYVKNKDDVKPAILPRSIHGVDAQYPCNLVTLGVGEDIDAELEMKKLLPQCKFFGADPIRQSGTIYKEIGQYFEVAVSDRDGFYAGTVRLDNGTYTSRNMSAVSFLNFLKNLARITRVDYLLMDNEGPEYEIMYQLLDGGILEKAGIVVCQVAMELHGKTEVHENNFNMTDQKYVYLLKMLVTNSSMLPFWAVPAGPHERSFYVNVKNPFCVDMFIKNWMSKDT